MRNMCRMKDCRATESRFRILAILILSKMKNRGVRIGLQKIWRNLIYKA